MSEGKAWVPTNVTGFFEVILREDPIKTGSKGVGLNLSKGVYVKVEVERADKISVNSNGVSKELLRGFLERRGLCYHVDVDFDYELPPGFGFGVSGAESLGSLLALGDALSLKVDKEKLARLAHINEVKNRSGLGDVISQIEGGGIIRVKEGAPGFGLTESFSIDSKKDLYVTTLSEISTSSILEDKMKVREINKSAEPKLSKMREEPNLNNFFDLSKKFTMETKLGPEKVVEIIKEVNEEGSKATMVQLGASVISMGKPGLLKKYGDVKKVNVSEVGAKII
ncbi:MAG: Pantoate kinase [Candidatus Methanohalarchaeum thermophilum]|uniref:Pantoate kinase n=1 Tax=Methanohalarchaeum thermophilum TaxID=1903181 RepID=A0A1Q6DXE3_METT1|nr:MAG: Pantoate kinase [Candidatus Methanohalarchaeum thermophilum]